MNRTTIETPMVTQDIPVVQTVGLCKTFRDFWRRPRVEAVKDLNLEIHAGEIVGLLGPNGSGKTTTIKMLLGLLFPSRGRISVFGKPPTDVSVKSRIGFLPEESYLYRFLVARETLDFYGRLFRLPSGIRRERIDLLLDMVGLQHEARRPIGEYSKGMARRIGLAQALINDPELLILDEPTSGLDPVGARQIKDVIRSLGQKGKTILLCSHVLADVEDVCDRVVILYGGQQRAEGHLSDLLQQRHVTQLTAATMDDDTLDEIRSVLRRRRNDDTIEVSHPRHRLEDYFLRVVEEAQRANIKTSGARAGGAVPDFLKQPTVTTTDEVVETLVAAADRPARPVEPTELPPATAPDQPTDRVIDELLVSSEGRTSDDPPPERTDSGPAASCIDSREPNVGDRSVIDDLLRGQDSDKKPDNAP